MPDIKLNKVTIQIDKHKKSKLENQLSSLFLSSEEEEDDNEYDSDINML